MTKEERIELCRQNAVKQRKVNEYEILNGIVYVKLTNTGNTMICDVDIWEQVKNKLWLENKNSHYAITPDRTNPKSVKYIKFHCFVMPYKSDYVVDHINRNRLDNRRNNLRYATSQINAINRSIAKNNTSGTTGVYQSKNGKWRAYIWVNGKSIYLGHYATKDEAIWARKQAEEKYFKPIIENKTC